MVRPLCLGRSASVRASRRPYAAYCAFVVHTFWPKPPRAVVLLLGARLDAGEVGARGGLGEQLAPHLLGGQHRAEVAVLLVLVAVRDQRRAEHADADDVEDPRHAGAPDLLVDDDLVERAEALPAVVRGPGDGGEAALGELALPLAAGVDVVGGAVGRLVLVLVEPGAHLGAVLGQLGGVVQVQGEPPVVRTRMFRRGTVQRWTCRSRRISPTTTAAARSPSA